jgi:hypothetical protein
MRRVASGSGAAGRRTVLLGVPLREPSAMLDMHATASGPSARGGVNAVNERTPPADGRRVRVR